MNENTAPAGELTDAQIKELFVQMHAAGDNWPQFARAVIAAHEAAQPAPMEAEAWAELHTLRLAVQGPDGFATWQDAAVAERVRRVKAEAAIAALRKDALIAATAAFGMLASDRRDELPEDAQALAEWVEVNVFPLLPEEMEIEKLFLHIIRAAMTKEPK